MEDIELNGIILDIDYKLKDGKALIRITFRDNEGVHTLFDPNFPPYFYLLPHNAAVDPKYLMDIKPPGENGEEIRATRIEEKKMLYRGRDVTAFRVYTDNPRNVPKLSETFGEFGVPYENDIVFWKRYLINKQLSPFSLIKVNAHKDGENLIVDEIKNTAKEVDVGLKYVCFDIESYNPNGEMPRMESNPIIMISYTDGKTGKVLSTKKIDKEFVTVLKNEKELIQSFVDAVTELDPDILVGYNSSGFDLPYLMKRASKLKVDFSVSRYKDEEARQEHHGLMETVRVPGRVNFDVFQVAKFVSVVGASEKLIRVNRFRLTDIYEAVSGNRKKKVDKTRIWEMWDGGGKELEDLAEYSLDDSLVLNELYTFFLPLEIEMARVTGTTLGETAISTTSQLVEYIMMKHAYLNNELIPGKPSQMEIAERLANPYEGAYVKTPDAGIYDKIVVFDFRGLYPSIIIAHNIDMSTICTDCKDYFEAPNGVKFRKDRVGIMPVVLKMLIDERSDAKKAFKKNPDNKSLAAKSTALKILANAFYGYLGYARARWYSRECASAVTAYGRLFITKTIDEAEKFGFKVLYGDTDSLFMLMGDKNKEDANAFVKKINSILPSTMELELEDFYVRGVFVGKRGGDRGAKKKYAMLSENGRIKIRGFELVRRDWSKIARDTQFAVLEAILKEGSKEKAVSIVKDTIEKLKKGDMNMKELVIHTQLRKGIRNYDVKSPELGAAQKAIARGVKTMGELEGGTIDYVITRSGGSISEKAQVEELAENYDAEYYIDHQVIPATLKILKELGYNADELKSKGAQKKL